MKSEDPLSYHRDGDRSQRAGREESDKYQQPEDMDATMSSVSEPTSRARSPHKRRTRMLMSRNQWQALSRLWDRVSLRNIRVAIANLLRRSFRPQLSVNLLLVRSVSLPGRFRCGFRWASARLDDADIDRIKGRNVVANGRPTPLTLRLLRLPRTLRRPELPSCLMAGTEGRLRATGSTPRMGVHSCLLVLVCPAYLVPTRTTASNIPGMGCP